MAFNFFDKLKHYVGYLLIKTHVHVGIVFLKKS